MQGDIASRLAASQIGRANEGVHALKPVNASRAFGVS
jgi:hypothetical protein